MAWIIDGVSWAFIAAGGFFCVVGAFGIIRMPDLYTRMHASGVIDPFGVSLILIGLMFQAGFTLVTAKLAVLVLLLLFTSPVACHALARAALHRGLEPKLAEKEGEPSNS
jgi:multicomponent Na+:H+ antiporter subunit G